VPSTSWRRADVVGEAPRVGRGGQKPDMLPDAAFHALTDARERTRPLHPDVAASMPRHGGTSRWSMRVHCGAVGWWVRITHESAAAAPRSEKTKVVGHQPA